MNIREIENLLEKYYEGLTSLEEENSLKEFFRGDSVPAHLASHAGQFLYYKKASAEEIGNPLFEQKVFERIDRMQVSYIRKNRSTFYYISGIAAGILLLIGLVFLLRDNVSDSKSVAGRTITDPEVAFTQTCDILAMVSTNFNKGMEKALYLGQFDKAMQKTQMLAKFYQYETLIINPDPIQGRP